MIEILGVLSNVFTLTFVVASMLALGFSLTVRQIVSPLSDVQLVLRALLVNFVLVPAAAYGLKTVIPIGESYGIGLILGLPTHTPAPALHERSLSNHFGRVTISLVWRKGALTHGPARAFAETIQTLLKR